LRNSETIQETGPTLSLRNVRTNELCVPQPTDRNVEAGTCHATLYFITETFRYSSFIQCYPSVENVVSVTSVGNIASMFGHLWIHLLFTAPFRNFTITLVKN